MKKWIVMGASSFSGAAFCRHLDQYSDNVVVPLSRQDGMNLSTAYGLNNITRALRVNADADYVVNFAALNMVAESWEHYRDYYSVNVCGVGWFARECKALLPYLKRFVQVSTPEVYGNTAPLLKEDAPYCPSTPYAVSRAAADMDLLAFQRVMGLPVCFTRTVNVYGEGQQLYRLIPKTILSILRGVKLPLDGGGVSQRSFIHIDDVAAGIRMVAERGRAGQTYHMAHPVQHTIKSVVEQICAAMGADFNASVSVSPERPGKDLNYHLDDQKIRDELGWRETISLRDNLPAIIEWCKGLADNALLTYEHRK